MQFGVGVLGATGYIGTPYRREIRQSPEDASIVALCARRRELLEAAGREDDAQLITKDWRQVVDHPDVNLVVVATPDALHCKAVLACARHQKHVVCEKPIGMNVCEARDMWIACRDAGIGHFVPYWTRYVPIFARARQIIRAGELGEVKALIYRWHNPRPDEMPFTWRDDADLSASGSIADVGSHAYDVMRWILGQQAVRVLAHADIISDPKPDLGSLNLNEALQWGQTHRTSGDLARRKGSAYDYAGIAMQFEQGTVGALVLSHASCLRKGLAPEVEFHGSKASLAIDRITRTLTIAERHEPPRVLETLDERALGNRFSEYAFPAVRARMEGRGHEHPGLEDGFQVQRFLDAAAQSALQGTWIEIPDEDP